MYKLNKTIEEVEKKLDTIYSLSNREKVDGVWWYPMPKYGSWSSISSYEGDLWIINAPMMEDGSISVEEACDVTAPENQEFLDAINDIFGTNFRFEEFSGR